MRDINCFSAKEDGNCLECKNGYDLSGSNCLIKRKIIDNCDAYSDQTGECISCKGSYNLTQGTCILYTPKIV